MKLNANEQMKSNLRAGVLECGGVLPLRGQSPQQLFALFYVFVADRKSGGAPPHSKK